MKSYEEIISMFELGDEKVYFSNKGQVSPKDVIITEDYTWSEASGTLLLYGRKFDCYIVLKEGEELSLEEYRKFSFSYSDKTKSEEEYGKCSCKRYYNDGIDLHGCEVYILYFNYKNNIIVSCNIDIYKIK